MMMMFNSRRGCGVCGGAGARGSGGEERRPEGAGGQGEQRGGENFLEEQKIISPPHFLPLSTLPALVELEEDPRPINPILPTYFSDLWQIFLTQSLIYLLNFPSHHISSVSVYLLLI